jgi:uncharacterized membrane protein YkvA (DUF1232 family)
MRDTYYNFLKEQMQMFKDQGKEFDEVILYIPEYFRLLSDLLDQDIVDKDARMLVNAALGYFVAPDDVLPDDTYGPMGYIDDTFMCCHVLKILFAEYKDLIYRLWASDEDFEEVMNKCYNNSSIFLDEKDMKDRVLVYSGLKDI